MLIFQYNKKRIFLKLIAFIMAQVFFITSLGYAESFSSKNLRIPMGFRKNGLQDRFGFALEAVASGASLAQLNYTTSLMGKLFDSADQMVIKGVFADSETKSGYVIFKKSSIDGEILHTKDGENAVMQLRHETFTITEAYLKKLRIDLDILDSEMPGFKGYVIKFISCHEAQIIAGNENIFGFSDGNVLYLTKEMLKNQDGLLHELGEGFFAEHPELLPEGINAHTYLRGCGKALIKLFAEAPKGFTDPEQIIEYLKSRLPSSRHNESEFNLIRLNSKEGRKGEGLLYGLQDRVFIKHGSGVSLEDLLLKAGLFVIGIFIGWIFAAPLDVLIHEYTHVLAEEIISFGTFQGVPAITHPLFYAPHYLPFLIESLFLPWAQVYEEPIFLLVPKYIGCFLIAFPPYVLSSAIGFGVLTLFGKVKKIKSVFYYKISVLKGFLIGVTLEIFLSGAIGSFGDVRTIFINSFLDPPELASVRQLLWYPLLYKGLSSNNIFYWIFQPVILITALFTGYFVFRIFKATPLLLHKMLKAIRKKTTDNSNAAHFSLLSKANSLTEEGRPTANKFKMGGITYTIGKSSIVNMGEMLDIILVTPQDGNLVTFTIRGPPSKMKDRTLLINYLKDHSQLLEEAMKRSNSLYEGTLANNITIILADQYDYLAGDHIKDNLIILNASDIETMIQDGAEPAFVSELITSIFSEELAHERGATGEQTVEEALAKACAGNTRNYFTLKSLLEYINFLDKYAKDLEDEMGYLGYLQEGLLLTKMRKLIDSAKQEIVNEEELTNAAKALNHVLIQRGEHYEDKTLDDIVVNIIQHLLWIVMGRTNIYDTLKTIAMSGTKKDIEFNVRILKEVMPHILNAIGKPDRSEELSSAMKHEVLVGDIASGGSHALEDTARVIAAEPRIYQEDALENIKRAINEVLDRSGIAPFSRGLSEALHEALDSVDVPNKIVEGLYDKSGTPLHYWIELEGYLIDMYPVGAFGENEVNDIIRSGDDARTIGIDSIVRRAFIVRKDSTFAERYTIEKHAESSGVVNEQEQYKHIVIFLATTLLGNANEAKEELSRLGVEHRLIIIAQNKEEVVMLKDNGFVSDKTDILVASEGYLKDFDIKTIKARTTVGISFYNFSRFGARLDHIFDLDSVLAKAIFSAGLPSVSGETQGVTVDLVEFSRQLRIAN